MSAPDTLPVSDEALWQMQERARRFFAADHTPGAIAAMLSAEERVEVRTEIVRKWLGLDRR